jgi:hypothetical protein
MGFFDDPAHSRSRGMQVGESIEGAITALAIRTNRYGREGLAYELDGDGRVRWAPARLWDAMADLRIDIGDRVRITRGPDEPARGDGKPATTWTIARLPLAPAAPAAGWGAGTPQARAAVPAGPTW